MDEPVVLRLGTVGSTQDAARGLAIGSLVTAGHQVSGRGRLDRRWEAPPGSALLVTFVTRPHAMASLAAGVAVAEACGPELRLKWPNDILLEGKKLAGILVEAGFGRCLVGIGINLTWAPEGGAKLGPVDPEALLEQVRTGLDRWLAEPPDLMLRRWRELADTLGSLVRVEIGRETFTGIAEAIDADGSLIVSGRPVSAGEITHLRALEAEAEPLRTDRG